MTLFIAGAGGFGRETLDAVIASRASSFDTHEVVFVDDALAGQVVRGLHVLRPEEAAGGEYVVGIADPVARREMVVRLEDNGLVALAVVHPRAVIGPDTIVAEGCVVLANAHVSSSVTLGRHVQINYNSTVGHDCALDEFVTVYPGANVSGNVHLEAGATMGSNSVVLQGLTVGPGTLVGAGAVVTKTLGAGLTVAGVPARPF